MTFGFTYQGRTYVHHTEVGNGVTRAVLQELDPPKDPPPPLEPTDDTTTVA